MRSSRISPASRYRATLAVSLALAGAVAAGSNAQQNPPPAGPASAPMSAPVEARVNTLLSQMTLEEKIDMLSGVGYGAASDTTGSTHALPRLGIPGFRMTDGPVGAHVPPPSTAYAAGIGLAATWDTALARRVGVQLGRDTRSRGQHFLLGPGVNIYRTPMNGRNFEYFGEDPFLGARIAVGYVQGVQSEGVSATIKHFLGNNSEFARNTSDSIIDERALREIYLPIFEAAVKEGQVGAIMDSYNLTNGAHMTQNGYLNTDVVKTQWGFPGIIMSDWGAVHDTLGAANGGMDLEMPDGQYLNRRNLLPAIAQGQVSVATVDDKVRRLLRLGARFGWLDREQKDLSIPRYNPQGRQAALDGAREGLVLLKNEGGLLPLDRGRVKTIAVIGPDAHPAIATAGGSGHVPPFTSVSILQGLSDALGAAGTVTYARGLPTLPQMASATHFTTEAGGDRGGVTVETFGNADLSGPPTATRVERSFSSGRPFSFEDFDPADFAPPSPPAGPPAGPRPGAPAGAPGAAPAAPPPSPFGRPAPTSTRRTGYYMASAAGSYILFVQGPEKFRALVDDQPVMDNWQVPRAALNQARLTLTAGPHKVVLEQSGGGGFGQPFLRLGIVPEDTVVEADARALAARADVAVVAVGFDDQIETEGSDREFALPPGQDALIRAVAAANRRTIVVVTSGGSVDVTPWLDRVPGLVEVWYPGQEGGTALAEALLGDVDPSGRLPISWERRLEDNPSDTNYYYTQPGTNKIEYREGIFVGYRGYEHNQVQPLFPFGYGLSYTTFRYANLSVTPQRGGTGPGPHYMVSFDVTNTGRRAGADVAQVYVADTHATVPRPPKELKGFARVELRPGQTRHVQVPLSGRAFTYYDVNAKQWHADPGEFTVLVGRSSERAELRGKVSLSQPVNLGVGD
ncbi:MAG: glycoside hydrolase family 3 C-terminal domain-containing protein [Armatimonadetes bacterium]|nr:glycoside hydrolase family 3 C-terminal domain-containing protein [Armatimonadota bacterium]